MGTDARIKSVTLSVSAKQTKRSIIVSTGVCSVNESCMFCGTWRKAIKDHKIDLVEDAIASFNNLKSVVLFREGGRACKVHRLISKNLHIFNYIWKTFVLLTSIGKETFFTMYNPLWSVTCHEGMLLHFGSAVCKGLTSCFFNANPIHCTVTDMHSFSGTLHGRSQRSLASNISTSSAPVEDQKLLLINLDMSYESPLLFSTYFKINNW